MKIFLYVLVILVSCTLVIIADHFLFVKSKDPKIIVKNSFKIFFLVYLVTTMFIHEVWSYGAVFNANKQSYLFFAYFFLQAIAFGGVYLLIKYLFRKYFIFEKKEMKNKSASITIYILSLIFFFIGVIGFRGTMWERIVYFDSSPDQIFITMFTPITGTDDKIIISFITGPLILACTLTYLFALTFFAHLTIKIKWKGNEKVVFTDLANKITSISIASAMLVSGLGFTVWGLGIDKIIKGYTVENSFIEENYIDPGQVMITAPENKRNLIHIYLESVENSFFTSENGGIMEENLLPNLLNLYDEGINFSNLSKNQGYGGPLKTYGGAFSVASITNQFFGLPMKSPVQFGQYSGEGKYLPGAVGIGDILDKYGYNLTMMRGGDADFGGLRNLFHDHGNFKMMDYRYAKENDMLPAGYNVNWGYEDEKLYKFAQDELTRLASLDQPFYCIVENADTHNPGFAFDGDTPVFGETQNDPNYAKTIKFSEKHVYEFVKWIQQQDFYDNTTIVIIGDHNTMDGSLFEHIDLTNYVRTTYNLILNPAPEVLKATSSSRFYNRQWSNFDMMPTLLAAMGFKIDGERLGVGTNLFSNVRTAFERLGYDTVNKALVCKSNFYNKQFVKNKTIYDGSNLK